MYDLCLVIVCECFVTYCNIQDIVIFRTRDLRVCCHLSFNNDMQVFFNVFCVTGGHV